MVSRVLSCGTTFHYIGERGSEQRDCIVFADGRVVQEPAPQPPARASLRAVMEAVDEAKDVLPEGQYLKLVNLAKDAWEAA